MSGWPGHTVDEPRRRTTLEGTSYYGTTPKRVRCRPPLSRSQLAVAAHLSRGYSHKKIAQLLGCGQREVRWQIDNAAQRIPGNLRASDRLIVWYRGAPSSVLENVNIVAPQRVPCSNRLSRAQLGIAALLSARITYGEIARRLGCSHGQVRWQIEEAAQRIPGDLRPSARLIAWYRGADRAVFGWGPM